MKEYFSHDFGARNDPKLIKVLMKLGQEGKGVFWDLIEMMYEQNGKLLLSECESYAFALRTKCEVIKSLINDYDLFVNDGERFWSISVLNRLDFRNTKSIKASESAKKRWENKDAMRTHSEGNAIKEKESKEKLDTNVSVELPKATSTFESRCEKFIDSFNMSRNAKYQVTDKIRTSLKARLKNYSPAQILTALENAKKDNFHIEQSYKYLTPTYLLRAEIIERYLNVATIKEGVLPTKQFNNILPR